MANIKCTIFGHDYQDTRKTEEERDSDGQNGKSIIVYQEKKCSRCGKKNKFRKSTKVVDTESKSEDKSKDTQPKEETNQNLKDKKPPERFIESEDTGVIIEDNNNKEVGTKDTSKGHQFGAYEGNNKNSYKRTTNKSSKGGSKIVSCESCSFSYEDEEVARREGDLCPECGSWLTVKD